MPNLNKETCIGCGLCTTTCPDCFELGADGKSQVKAGCDGTASCVEEAINGCPVGAISK